MEKRENNLEKLTQRDYTMMQRKKKRNNLKATILHQS